MSRLATMESNLRAAGGDRLLGLVSAGLAYVPQAQEVLRRMCERDAKIDRAVKSYFRDLATLRREGYEGVELDLDMIKRRSTKRALKHRDPEGGIQ
ncbi:MAG TPA: hypothetical protein VN736_29120 [Candidatus Limnocylindrales bacterium]|nr:hypothetical protein [Candidatus Limnocylindrales bacterium]